MKKIFFRSHFILFFMGAVFTTIETWGNSLPDSIPKGWHRFADSAPDIIIGTDTTAKHSGKASGFIQRDPSPIYGLGVMLQSIVANAYINKRVRLTAYMKTKDVEIAFLYLRADGVIDGADTAYTFASTEHDSPMQETTDWTRFSLVIDIPENSRHIDFGVALKGQGILWIDDFTLEVVDQSIPSNDWIATGILKTKRVFRNRNFLPNAEAFNLGFEDK